MLWAGHAGELELRRSSGGGARLRGSFPYDRPAVLSDGGRTGRPRKELFAPHAFRYSVEDAASDIVLLSGHDFSKPLASKFTKTLAIRDTAEALTFDATITPAIAETTHGRDALALLEAGIATGLSPGFRLPPTRAVEKAEEVTEEPVDPAKGQHGAIIRRVLEAILVELSVVTKAAFPEAMVSARNWNPDPEAPDAGLQRVLARYRR